MKRATGPRLSVIVPFHRGLAGLERCLAAMESLPIGAEIIVAADGAVEPCHEVARRYGATVLDLPGPNGPAVARNAAAQVARGDVLVFVDADVVPSPASLHRIAEIFRRQPRTAAVIGAYDEHPGDSGFVSQYKNLAHSYIHQSSATVAQTFWAGFGAVRRTAFEAVGGFDERFRRPSVEDIDLGYRLTRAGYTVRLDPSLTACHLKRWTLRGMVASDIFDRGIPWTQLILRYGRMNSDLNVRSSYRVCVVLAYLSLLSAAVGFFDPWALLAIPLCFGAIIGLSRNYYTFFLRKRGLWFLIRLFPLHLLYHLYNGVSFATGTAIYLAAREYGVQLPGALPTTAWTGPSVEGAGRTASPPVAVGLGV